MKKHPRMLAEAGISPARYAELRDICRQYREMRQTVALVERYGHHRFDLPVGGFRDPTGNTAALAASMPEARRVRMIEQAAATAGGKAIGRAILRSVTEGMDYERLRAARDQRDRPPCGQRQFYRIRLAFYVELDRRLWEDGIGG